MTHQTSSHLWLLLLVASTSGRLHSEFVRLLFLQTHRETDLFFAVSGVKSQVTESTSGLFQFHRGVFFSHLTPKVDSILTKAVSLRVNLNLDGTPITSRTHNHPSHSQTSPLVSFQFINLVFIFRCSSFPSNPVYVRRVDSSVLVFSLSSKRHSYRGLVFNVLRVLRVFFSYNR
jgi:hypothetical protein